MSSGWGLFREHRFDIFELFAIAAALVFFLAFALFAIPLALFSSAALAVMILRRLGDLGRAT